ncbi:DUF3810 domain-containing protein [Flavobacterium quisquiliarum]|uniref:DUF3810 domain-containing protein n=1 Tax=Flavobacterium quisquiliarum TaxID=1834436 RepID=A0ABV8WA89_9FLAO|nr:DUF3810 domain-containing protein [Flavobacterium quisquiliarum]MBW1656384.1 DUF3810 family protein [Flavobacterium quisquiliarum]NWL03949.1 DUF3810 domain-containing protein [Flavobacterium collinsii]
MKSKYILPLFLLVQIIFLRILRYFPDYVEGFYSNNLFLRISHFSRIALGKIPFSLGDCIYALLILSIIGWFWKIRKNWRTDWKDNLLTILGKISVFYFFFHLLWAFNYYRKPLFEKMEIKREYSDADLYAFTKRLIVKTNEIQLAITKNKSEKIVFPYSQKESFDMILNGYDNLANEYPYFKYETLSVKKSLFSVPLTYMGFGGYLNPFTNEAQINYLLPMYNFPVTTSHEMAHQIGYASENECNFIGVLASVKNDNLYYQYSGYSFVLRYCLGIWKYKNENVFNQLKKTVHPGILKNYKESEDFWKKYDTFIDKGFHFLYDNFLKSNNQKDGMESYSKFIDLMINYYRDKKL